MANSPSLFQVPDLWYERTEYSYILVPYTWYSLWLEVLRIFIPYHVLDVNVMTVWIYLFISKMSLHFRTVATVSTQYVVRYRIPCITGLLCSDIRDSCQVLRIILYLWYNVIPGIVEQNKLLLPPAIASLLLVSYDSSSRTTAGRTAAFARHVAHPVFRERSKVIFLDCGLLAPAAGGAGTLFGKDGQAKSVEVGNKNIP